MPVPSSTTLAIICASSPALFSEITRSCSSGSMRSLTRPSLSTTFSTSRGRINEPLLPTAAATIAIWSGVTWIWPSSPPWPMATRPMSKPPSLFTRLPFALRMPLASIWSSGKSSSGSELKPNRFMYFIRVSGPICSPTCAHTVFTELVRASVRLIGPKLAPPELASGAPLIVRGEEPSTTESGVNLPESSAAAAVTTLKVEPGG